MGNYKELRDRLTWQLREKGIRDEKVLDAIARVPRHLFIGNENQKYTAEEMYEDVPLSIGQGQTISQPFTVAYMTELLQVDEKDKILEIGTGSGYQSAVLLQMGAAVYTIERQEQLFRTAKSRFESFGYSRLHMMLGDGNNGIPEHAPYDKIIVTAASSTIPPELIRQLKVGGIMVIPINGDVQRMKRISKLSGTEIKVEDFGHFRFVPLLSGIVMN